MGDEETNIVWQEEPFSQAFWKSDYLYKVCHKLRPLLSGDHTAFEDDTIFLDILGYEYLPDCNEISKDFVAK